MDTYCVADDVYGITLDSAETLSSFLIVDEEPVLIEAGTAKAADALIDSIRKVGVDPPDLRHVVVSHYHLDHVGGAGAILEAAPDCSLYLHGSMVRWVTESDRFDRLVESTAESLADQFDDMGAPGHALPADRITTVGDDGHRIELARGRLDLVHTPGHTPDHLAAYFPAEDVMFSNEAIGRYFPRTDVLHPPVTLPTFDIEATEQSIDTLAAFDPAVIAFSHVGFRTDPGKVVSLARSQLDRFRARIGELYEATDGDVETTTEQVREELLQLDDEYPAHVAAVQARVCTLGVLNATGHR